MKIKGAVLREPNKPYSIEDLELDSPKENEVLIKYVYTGYCHSDLHLLLGEIPIALPLVAGHEGAGIVEAVLTIDAMVTGFVPGTRNTSTTDAPFELLLDSVERRPRRALSNSFGFGGNNCSVVFAAA